jgi:hypothetical protein
MSHDSGFRKGSHDFAQKSGPPKKQKGRGAKAFEDRMAKRFHEHEREVKAETAATDEPEKANEESPDETG